MTLLIFFSLFYNFSINYSSIQIFWYQNHLKTGVKCYRDPEFSFFCHFWPFWTIYKIFYYFSINYSSIQISWYQNRLKTGVKCYWGPEFSFLSFILETTHEYENIDIKIIKIRWKLRSEYRHQFLTIRDTRFSGIPAAILFDGELWIAYWYYQYA